VAAVTVSAITSLVLATYIYQETGKVEQFFYHELAGLVHMHAIYLSMYVCFAILILLQWLVSVWDKHEGTSKQIFLMILVVFLFAYNIVLSARMPTLALCLVVFAGVLKVFYDRKGLVQGISIILIMVGILLAGILLSPVNKQRYKEAFDTNSAKTYREGADGRSLRLMKWDCCKEILKTKWLTGVGIGDVQDELNQCYKDKEYTYLIGEMYNAHNQYFQTWLGLGIVGLLWFLAILGHGIKIAWERKNYLHLGFVVLFALVCLTESTLPVHKGVVFFMFFTMLFLMAPVAWPWRSLSAKKK